MKKKFLNVFLYCLYLCGATALLFYVFLRLWDRPVPSGNVEVIISRPETSNHFGATPSSLTPFLKMMSMPASKNVVQEKKLSTGEVIYKHLYTHNQYGLRHHEVNPSLPHVAMVGCSFIFGDGVADNQTLPYLLQQRWRERAVYNFGIPGSGPHDLFEYFELFPFQDYLKNSSGVMIYFFYNDHINRANLRAEYLAWAGGDHPYFALSEKQEAVLVNRSRHHPRWKALEDARKLGVEKSYLSKEQLLHPNYSADEIELVAALVEKMKLRYLSFNSKNRFYFMYYPVFGIDHRVKGPLEAALMKRNILILDGARGAKYFTSHSHAELSIPYDGHPSARAHELMAEFLSELKQEL